MDYWHRAPRLARCYNAEFPRWIVDQRRERKARRNLVEIAREKLNAPCDSEISGGMGTRVPGT